MTKIANAGFTLIEILVVVVIIAIVSAVAILNIKSPAYPKFMGDANKIAVTFELIGDQAQYSNGIIVCGVDHGASNCQEYKDDQWQSLYISNIVPWNWPRQIRIQKVLVDGKLLKSGQTFHFSPMGNLQKISILITDGQFSAWIDSNFNGEFTVEH